MEKVIIASNNKKKLRELKEILGGCFDVISLAEAGIVSSPEETGDTFEENSYIKAFSAMKESNMISVADDSGLSVFALNGAPGVYSSRYCEDGNDEKNNALLLKNMEKTDDRRAEFVSFITMLFPDGRKITAEGRISGVITREPAGEYGFGYDPLFYIPSLGKTMAQLSPEEKNKISHRGLALLSLKKELGT